MKFASVKSWMPYLAGKACGLVGFLFVAHAATYSSDVAAAATVLRCPNFAYSTKLTAPDIHITPSIPNGTVLQSYEWTLPAISTKCNTTGRGYSSFGQPFAINPNFSGGIQRVEATGGAIGMRFYSNGKLVTSTFQMAPWAGYAVGFSYGDNISFSFPATTVKMEIIKLGDKPAGTRHTASGGITYSVLNLTGTQYGGGSTASSRIYGFTFIWDAPTCTVSTSSITIPLGDVEADSLTAVGSTSPISAPQNINLACQTGVPLSMTVGSSPVSGTTDVFPITGGSGAAQGVGVQLFNGLANDAVIVPGAKTRVMNSTTAKVAIPIKARYYRTGTITPGDANANIVATFSYN